MPQKVLFPMEYHRPTQDENAPFSHAGSLAMDWGGLNSTANCKLYAPCDMRCVRVRREASHETYFESVEPVEHADGFVGFAHFTFMHDNVINPNVREGAVLKQGEYFADEGTFANGRGSQVPAHSHIEAGRGKSPARQIQNSRRTFITAPQSHLYDVFWIASDTVMLQPNAGIKKHNWKRTSQTLLKPNTGTSAVRKFGLMVGPSIDLSVVEALATNLKLPYKKVQIHNDVEKIEMDIMYVGGVTLGDATTLENLAASKKIPVNNLELITDKTVLTASKIGPMTSGDVVKIEALARQGEVPVFGQHMGTTPEKTVLYVGFSSNTDTSTLLNLARELKLPNEPLLTIKK